MKKVISIIIGFVFLIGCFTNCFAITKDYDFLITKKTSNIREAIYLAKNSCSYSLYCYLHNKSHRINEIEVPRSIKHAKGPVHIFGWAATKYDDQTYIVTYVYKDLNESVYHAYAFDVNLKAKVVRVITGKKQYNNYELWHRIATSYKGIEINRN